MATHPFAVKIEKALLHAKRLRDELLARKTTKTGDSLDADPPGTWRDSLGRLRIVTRIFGFRKLGNLASNDPGAIVEPGEATASRSNRAWLLKRDPTFARLQDNLAREAEKCAHARNIASGPGGTKQLEDGTFVPIRRKAVSLECPGYTAARKAMEDYYRKMGDFGPANSGGGSGGGF